MESLKKKNETRQGLLVKFFWFLSTTHDSGLLKQLR